MKRLFFLYGIESLILCCLVSMGLFNVQNDFYSLVLTFIFTIEFFVFGFFMDKSMQKEYIFVIIIFFIGFALRYGAMLYDDYYHVFDFEWNGDCKDFRESAINFFYTNEAKFRKQSFGTSTFFMGLVTKLYGPQRIIIRYINTLSFMLGALITYKGMKSLSVSENIRILLISWMIFTPQNIKNTLISNREGYIQLMVALSVLSFILYVNKNKFIYILIAFISGLIACGFHGGCIGIFIGFIFYILFFEKETKLYQAEVQSFVLFAVFAVFFMFLYNRFADVLFGKIANIESVEDIALRNQSNEGGGSDYYIPGGNATTIGVLLLTSPLRMIYFMLSPMPWYWRGLADIGAFITTSIPQLLILWNSIKIIPKMKNSHNKLILVALIVSAIAIFLIFGWGCKNAGTAIRHRDKFLSLFVIILSILLNAKGREKNEKNSLNTTLFR